MLKMNIALKLIEHPDPFNMDPNEAKEIRLQAVYEFFDHHFGNSPLYSDFCSFIGIRPENIREYEDLSQIPWVPSSFFKALTNFEDPDKVKKLASVDNIIRSFSTSGSTGEPSLYPFDAESLKIVNESNSKIFYHVGGIREKDFLLMLTNPPNVSDTGMVQGMFLTIKGILWNESQIDFAIKEGEMDSKHVRDILSKIKDRIRHLYGPPFAYNDISDQMIQKNMIVKLDEDSKAFTTGGWKRVKGVVTREIMNEKIQNAFGISQKNIRDGYGLTDIMSIFLECEFHQKHVPPWLYISARDPEDKNLTKEVPKGERGVAVIISPIIESYPAAVVPGDYIRITHDYEEKCECGRNGATIEFVGRYEDAGRGCALREERLIKHMGTLKVN
jgi:long-chain-fatty-acid---luciferin-component ligase